MSILSASAAAQSLPAGFSSESEAEALQRLFRAAYEGVRAKREFNPSSSCDAMLGEVSLDNSSDAESKVYFAIL
ncbi:MAG: hypothetical protein IT342_21495 [Candidatus Melainabacteria bacterium]|nr:hypothetical protein [Candidatus Melainabacteria bacterium]